MLPQILLLLLMLTLSAELYLQLLQQVRMPTPPRPPPRLVCFPTASPINKRAHSVGPPACGQLDEIVQAYVDHLATRLLLVTLVAPGGEGEEDEGSRLAARLVRLFEEAHQLDVSPCL